jgi:hypothetical protein
VSAYGEELAAAERQALAAFEAMDAWLSRPLDGPDVAGAVLEGYARDLRESRERIRALVAEYGVRDDLEAALERSEVYHRSLGLSIKDKPEIVPDEEDDGLSTTST